MATNNVVNDVYLKPTGFYASASGGVAITGDGTRATIIFDTLLSGSGYNTATGFWTVPGNGTYLIGTILTTWGYTSANTNQTIFLSGSNFVITAISIGSVVGAYDSVGNLTLAGMRPFVMTGYDPDNPVTISVLLQVENAPAKNVGIASGSIYSSFFWAQQVL